MANTQKGIKTQESILKSAKHLFYQHGFDMVSLNDICLHSATKLGTLTYYFPKKWNIIDSLYQQYMARVQNFVRENTENIPDAERYCYVILMYYYNIYADDSITRFHYRIMLEGSMNEIFNDTKQFILPLLGENIDDGLLNLYIIADNAVRRELNLAFMRDSKEHDLASIVELIRRIHLVAVRLYGFDTQTLDEYLERAYKFLLAHRNDIKLIEK